MSEPRAADVAAERLRRRDLLASADLYLVTEESLSAGRRSEAVIEAALEAGTRVVQIREKDGTARRAYEIAVAARTLTRRHGALLIVNDRVDIARACDADGVHLGQADLPIAEARRSLGGAALLGLSITAAEQLGSHDVAAADCLGVGAVYPTGSKLDAETTGLGLLGETRAAMRDSRIPTLTIVAIGGITAANAAATIRAGADVVAVITAVTAAPDPGLAAAELIETVRAAQGLRPSSRSSR